MVECALNLGVEFFVLQLFPGDPAGGGDQGLFALQVLDVAHSHVGHRSARAQLQAEDGFQHVQRCGMRVAGF